MAVVDPPMVDVLIDLRLTRFFFLDTGNWPRSLDRVDAAYGRMKHRDAKRRKIWTDPESRTVRHRFVRVTGGGKTTKEKVRSSTARCTLPASRLQWWRSPRCGSLQTNSESADLMRMVSSPNDEFVFAQHQADPGADRGGMHDQSAARYVSIPPRRPTFHRQFDKTNTYG